MLNTNWDYLVVKLGPDGVERWDRATTDLARASTAPARSSSTPQAMSTSAASRTGRATTGRRSSSRRPEPSPGSNGTRDQGRGGRRGRHVDAAGNSYLAGWFVAVPGGDVRFQYDATGGLVWSVPITLSSDKTFAWSPLQPTREAP